MTTERYIGGELELFARAENWKRYWAAQIQPYLGDTVLEVGAGIGASTEVLKTVPRSSWLCLEPDPELAKQISRKIETGALPTSCKTATGTIADLPAETRFDSILYIDVLEHIERDREELAQAAELLKPDGTLIVLAPAHQVLYSPFDRSIGHYRRYDKSALLNLSPRGMTVVTCRYLDSIGLLASLANKLVLRKSLPSEQDIALWDRKMVPISKWADRAFGYRLGKSVFAVWRRS